MNEKNNVINSYFEWIRSLVEHHLYSPKKTYFKLLSYLFDTEFTYTIVFDENRAGDGLYLRYKFAIVSDLSTDYIDSILYDKPCSVLEMMVALALRCDESIMYDDEYGSRIEKWFWSMITSLGLRPFDDANYDIFKVKSIVDTFLKREYARDGKGGLFTVPGCRDDLREVEIWYQLCWYLNSIA